MSKRIERAALLLEGKQGGEDVVVSVKRPGRHHHIIHTLALHGMKTPIGAESRGQIQGFVTEDGEFLNREEAEVYAREHGQISGMIGSILTSEDLW